MTVDFGCQLTTLKCWMFGYICFLWLIGSVFMGCGVVSMLDSQRFFKYTYTMPESDDIVLATWVLNGLIATAIFVGTILVVIGFIGCFADATESQKMITIFFVSLLLILTTLLTISFVLILQKEKIKVTMIRVLEDEAANVIDDGFLAAAHFEFDCCGVISRNSCEKDYPPFGICDTGNRACRKGCFNELWTKIVRPKIYLFLGVAFSCCALLFIGLVLSLMLFLKIGRHYSEETVCF